MVVPLHYSGTLQRHYEYEYEQGLWAWAYLAVLEAGRTATPGDFSFDKSLIFFLAAGKNSCVLVLSRVLATRKQHHGREIPLMTTVAATQLRTPLLFGCRTQQLLIHRSPATPPSSFPTMSFVINDVESSSNKCPRKPSNETPDLALLLRCWSSSVVWRLDGRRWARKGRTGSWRGCSDDGAPMEQMERVEV